MASPPFNINQSLPGDSDIVSQHPPNARTFRDIVESWLLINHDTNGNHARIDMPRIASPSTPAASVDVLYTTTRGRLKIKHPDGTEEFVGHAPGFMGWYTIQTLPNGWLLADGTAVSRTSFADLFDVLGTAYGSGDGLTTFNLPDLRGRTPIGADVGAGRFSIATMSATSTGGFGGSESRFLLSGNIPGGVPVSVSSLSVAVSVPTVSVSVSGSISGSSSGSTASGSISGTASGGSVTGTASGSVGGSFSGATDPAKPIVWDTGGLSSLNIPGGGAAGVFTTVAAVHRENAMTVSGTITGSISSTSLNGSITSPATVTGSFSGAAVSAGTVSGTFSGSGTGSGSGSGSGTGAGATTGSAAAFGIMQPSFVLYPLIKT